MHHDFSQNHNPEILGESQNIGSSQKLVLVDQKKSKILESFAVKRFSASNAA